MRSQVLAHSCLDMCVPASHNRMQSAMFSLARAFSAFLSSPVEAGVDRGMAGAAAFGEAGDGAAGEGVAACASAAPAPRTSDSDVTTTILMNVLEPPRNLERARRR